MSEEIGFLTEIFAGWQGEGSWAGYRQIFLRLAGCRQACAYCDTPGSRQRPRRWRIQHPWASGLPRFGENPLTVSQLLKILKIIQTRYGPFHSLAITGGEPLEQTNFVYALLRKLRHSLRALKILLETNGLHAPEILRLAPWIDFIAADIKIRSTTGRPTPWSTHRKFLKAAQSRPGCAKLVVGPQSPVAEIARAARCVSAVNPHWDLVIQPQSGLAWSRRSQRHLDRLFQAAGRLHPSVRMIPQIHFLFGNP